MAIYHPRAKEVEAGNLGRVLDGTDPTYELLTVQLRGDEQLWVCSSTNAWSVVMLIPNKWELDRVLSLDHKKGPYTFYGIEPASS